MLLIGRSLGKLTEDVVKVLPISGHLDPVFHFLLKNESGILYYKVMRVHPLYSSSIIFQHLVEKLVAFYALYFVPINYAMARPNKWHGRNELRKLLMELRESV